MRPRATPKRRQDHGGRRMALNLAAVGLLRLSSARHRDFRTALVLIGGVPHWDSRMRGQMDDGDMNVFIALSAPSDRSRQLLTTTGQLQGRARREKTRCEPSV